MKYHVVLFDLDGTLVNSMEDISNAFNAALVNMGYEAADKEVIKEFVGSPLKLRFMTVLPEDRRDENMFPVFREIFRGELKKHWDKATHAYDGVVEMLAELERLGLKIGILSNKIDEVTKLVADKYLSGCNFSIVRGLLPGKPEKPDPMALRVIAEELGEPAGKVIYVGDTQTDMKTAVDAGMFPVGVSWGFQPADRLKEHGAGLIINHPSELVEYIKTTL